jgi:hypothetical protein
MDGGNRCRLTISRKNFKTNFVIFKKSLTPILLFSLFMSCTNEMAYDPQKPDLYEDTSSFTDRDCAETYDAAIEGGYPVGVFHDELLKDGIDSFMVRDMKMGLIISSSSIALDSMIERYVEYHQMDFNIVHDFFYTLLEHKEFILNTSNREAIIDGIICYGINSTGSKEGQLVVRGIFTTIAGWLGQGGPCTAGGIFGRLFDAAASTTGALIATPIPIINGLAWMNAANDFREYIRYDLDC